MTQTKYKILSTFFLFLCFMPISTKADLLISPLQVIIDGREKSEKVVLVNPSQNTNTYRLEWTQLRQVEGIGRYRESTDEERESTLDLEDFAVYSPRQITLKPNEKQIIRIGIRRPAELLDGEYKSHLRFKVMPDLSRKNTALNNKNLKDDERSFGAQIYASHAIPVIYRAGQYDASFEIGEATFSNNKANSKLEITFPVKRQGIHGIVGQINIYHTTNGGEKTLIAQQNNANVFAEIAERDFKVTTTVQSLEAGTLLIEYYKAEGNTSEYKLVAQRSFSVSQ